MTTMKERFQADLGDAMRAQDDARRRTLRMLIAAVKNAEIAAMHPLSDSEVVAVTRSQAKQRNDSIAEFKKAGRQDLVDREQEELDILLTYLPQTASRDVVEAAAREVILATGASSVRDLGKVMPLLMKRFGDAADGKLISEVVREQLGS